MEKRVQDYTSEILEVVKSNASPAVLCQRLQDYHENDIADILEKLSPAERCKLYRILDMDIISDIFEYTEEADVVKYLEEMNIRKAAAILSKMVQMYYPMFCSSLIVQNERSSLNYWMTKFVTTSK